MRWRVRIEKLETTLRIGIHPHEREPQRLIVSADILAEYPHRPKTIAECVNYDGIHDLVVRQWPVREHVDLLETLAVELLTFIFRQEERVISVTLRLAKPDIFAEAEWVGVEAEWTRDDYRRLSAS